LTRGDESAYAGSRPCLGCQLSVRGRATAFRTQKHSTHPAMRQTRNPPRSPEKPDATFQARRCESASCGGLGRRRDPRQLPIGRRRRLRHERSRAAHPQRIEADGALGVAARFGNIAASPGDIGRFFAGSPPDSVTCTPTTWQQRLRRRWAE